MPRQKSKTGNDSMHHRATLDLSAALMMSALLSACSSNEGLLAPTPAIFAPPQNRAPVVGAQPTNAADELNLLYITDRAPIMDPQTNALSYGSERSHIMSFGSIDIRFEPDSNGAAGEMQLSGIREIG